MLNIGGVTPFTTIDYPGELAAVIFCQGCPWRCPYCHNPHLLAADGQGAVPWAEVLEFLCHRRGLLDGVVFSGGEPTMQAGLPAAVLAVRELGFKAGLHTAGPFPQRLLELLPHLDWIGMDLKAPFEEYERITAIPGSGEEARASAELLRRSGVPHRFRTTLDPFLLEGGRIESMQRMVATWGEELSVQNMKQPDAGKSGSQARQVTVQRATQQSSMLGTSGKAPDGSGKGEQVKGFEMKESGQPASGAASAPIPWLFMLGFALVVGLIG